MFNLYKKIDSNSNPKSFMNESLPHLVTLTIMSIAKTTPEEFLSILYNFKLFIKQIIESFKNMIQSKNTIPININSSHINN